MQSYPRVTTLPHYPESSARPYALCFITYRRFDHETAAFLRDHARYVPGVPYPPHYIFHLTTILTNELLDNLKKTDYALIQQCPPQPHSSQRPPSTIHPMLGLSFGPQESPSYECALYPEQLQILRAWTVKFDALFWLENVTTASSGIFSQQQQQQRDLRLSSTLHEVNRQLVEWDNRGRGSGRRSVSAKVSRRLPSGREDRDEIDEEEGVRRRAKKSRLGAAHMYSC